MKVINFGIAKALLAAILVLVACETSAAPHLKLVPGFYTSANVSFLYKHVGQRICITGQPLSGVFANYFLLHPTVVDDVFYSAAPSVTFAHSNRPLSSTQIYTVCGHVVHTPLMNGCEGAACNFFRLDRAAVRVQ